MTLVTGDFHMVKTSQRGKFQTYEIYCNNKPFIKPTKRFKLSRRNAIGLTNFFNAISSERLVKRVRN